MSNVLSECRGALAAGLQTVPGISRVEPYDQREIALTNCPYATLFLKKTTRKGLEAAQRALGFNDYELTWSLFIFIGEITNWQTWQETSEQLTADLRAYFDSHPQPADPVSGLILDEVVLENVEPFIERKGNVPVAGLVCDLLTLVLIPA